MTLDTDAIVDRRRLRRRLALWRIAALALVGIVIAGVALSTVGEGLTPRSRAHVARVSITGVIADNRARLEMLKKLEDSNASAVIVYINSPGGGVEASEALYKAIRRLAEKKPTAAVYGSLAASGGYLASLGAERIFSPETTLTGSIGVLIQYPNVVGLLDKIGVNMESIKSSPLKAVPNGVEPTSPEARAAIQSVVTDSYDWFRDLVAERRQLSGADLDAVTDGRVFTGRQALQRKLVDALGAEDAARDWLAQAHGIDRELPVRDWRAESSTLSAALGSSVLAGLARSFGLEALAQHIAVRGGLFDGEVVGLDGLVAVWHPALEK